ncbi:TPA: hypothetical protein H1009_01065 [archaeon]|nr:hypothetical protein [Candidatus Naiadarchaeales archaeon SRR2090153.bin461]
MVNAANLVEEFFKEFRVAAASKEINNYLALRGEVPLPDGWFNSNYNYIKWEKIVRTIYKVSQKINPLIWTKGGATTSGRKKYMIPLYSTRAKFYFPKGHEEFVWARFINFVYSSKERQLRWMKEGGHILPRSAGIFILTALYAEGEPLSLKKLITRLYTGKLTNIKIEDHVFEPYLKALIPSLVSGSTTYDLENQYLLTPLSQKACKLAFDPEFQEKNRLLEEKKIFAGLLRNA